MQSWLKLCDVSTSSLAPLGSLERAQAGANLLGVPVLQAELAPCWRCGITTADRSERAQGRSCWPSVTTRVPCTCAIERTRPAPLVGARSGLVQVPLLRAECGEVGERPLDVRLRTESAEDGQRRFEPCPRSRTSLATTT